MDREQMVEKIENILFEYDSHEECAPWVHIKYAHEIIDAIIPEGSVVLPREEYNELRSRPTNCTYIDISKDFVKECQKEIEYAVNERTIAIIRDLIGHRFVYYVKDETNGTVTCCADYVVYKDDVKFLEEKYKVKVE